MAPSPAELGPGRRSYLSAFAAQLVLTAAAVLVSRLGLPSMSNAIAVMLIAAVNAVVVATMLMGVRRDGRYVSMLMLATLFFIVGLLVWPAWDVWERGRTF